LAGRWWPIGRSCTRATSGENMHNVVYIKSVLGSARSRVQRLTNSIKCRGNRPQTACSSGATHERHKGLSSNVTWLATSYAARCAAAGMQASRARRTCLADRAGRDRPDSTRLQGRRGASGDARRETEWAGVPSRKARTTIRAVRPPSSSASLLTAPAPGRQAACRLPRSCQMLIRSIFGGDPAGRLIVWRRCAGSEGNS